MIDVKCPNCGCQIHVDEMNKIRTNGDYIRSLTNNQLVDYVYKEICPPDKMFIDSNKIGCSCSEDECKSCRLSWLNSNSKDN